MKLPLLISLVLVLSGCLSIENDQHDYLIDKRDNHKYSIVKIGNQIWMSENLNFKTDSGSWVYGNKPENAIIYGRLYDWKTACDVCPEGWHLPSDDEWMVLETTLGIKEDVRRTSYRGTDQGLKIKSTDYWINNTGGTDSSGFSARPAGRFFKKEYAPNEPLYGNGFYDAGKLSIFWTSSDSSILYPGHAWFRWVSDDKEGILRDYSNKPNGFSVRCIKNIPVDTKLQND